MFPRNEKDGFMGCVSLPNVFVSFVKISVEVFVKLLIMLNNKCFLEMRRMALWDV